MKIAFILKLYCTLALLLGLFIFFTCGEQAFIATAIALTGGAFTLLTFIKPAARYMQEGGAFVAYMEKDGHEYRIEKDGAFVNMGGSWLVSNRCPSPKVANEVRRLNEGQSRWIRYLVPCLLISALIAYSPALFPSVLGTPSSVSYISNMSTLFNAVLICLGVFATFAFALRFVGGVNATLYTNPLSVSLDVPELPELAPNNADFAVIATIPGETTAGYLNRIKEVEGKTDLLIVAPKGAPVWYVKTPEGEAALNRVDGSPDKDIPPVPFPQGEGAKEYRRNIALVVHRLISSTYTNTRIAERVAASPDPLMEVVKTVSFCIALLFALPAIAQNNAGQALEYLGDNFERVKPGGAVAFHYAKLSVKVQGDGKKSFSDLLTHSTGFDDAGKWGALQVVTVDGMAIARQAKKEPVAAKEQPKGEDVRQVPEQKRTDVMGGVKTYFSTAETERRIMEREKAVDEFSKEYGDNIRRDFLSMCLIPLQYLFWFLALIGGAFWVASYISAKESAIFSNGVPVFGTIQNWVHGWSAGVLYLIVMLYAVVYVLYSTLAWIMPIETPIFSIPLFIGNVVLAASVAHRIIPNKRVRGGQNFSGANTTGQRQLNG